MGAADVDPGVIRRHHRVHFRCIYQELVESIKSIDMKALFAFGPR